MIKNRKLGPENITGALRKFTGKLSIQIDGQRWIELSQSTNTDKFLNARNNGTLKSVSIDKDMNVTDVELKKRESYDRDKILEELNKIYRSR